jgi:hypothetical protein
MGWIFTITAPLPANKDPFNESGESEVYQSEEDTNDHRYQKHDAAQINYFTTTKPGYLLQFANGVTEKIQLRLSAAALGSGGTLFQNSTPNQTNSV